MSNYIIQTPPRLHIYFYLLVNIKEVQPFYGIKEEEKKNKDKRRKGREREDNIKGQRGK